jgi:hypothetical protein
VDALRSYYPFLDSVLGPFVEPAAGRTLMVVTQPGRVQTRTGGLFAVARGQHEAGYGGTHSALDVAPTVWCALGLPLSRELAGKPEADLLRDWATHGDRYVATYGRPFVEALPRVGKPLDQEMIDRLRSLGYVK